jgi:hypothetical protein
MRAPSLQILSVENTFGVNGWHCELLEGRDVIRAQFNAHHTRIVLHAQSYTPINALSVVGECTLRISEDHQAAILELLNRANKNLNLGSFEFDIDRQQLCFRITNMFEREKYDADIVTSMVHCAIAELDRITPYAAIVQRTRADLLDDLDLVRLLEREDLIPPVPGDDDDLP